MKRYFTLLLGVFSVVMFSQEEAWVYFNGKPGAQAFLDHPLSMLSARALDRRVNQHIALDFTDVPIEQSYINQIDTRPGITVMAKSKWLNALHIRAAQSDVLALQSLSFVDKVVFANKALNATAKKGGENKRQLLNHKLKTKSNYGYGTSGNQIQMLNGQVLHEHNYKGSDKLIAVLDAGFPGVDTAEPFHHLMVNGQILGGYDFVTRKNNFYTGDDHGTMVLSTMAAYKENALVGTAPDASYYLFITEDVATEKPVEESLWVEAAEKADSLGVDIITTSLGYFEYDDANYSHTYSEMNGLTTFSSRGAQLACSKGMIVVASAGNEGATAEPHIGSPADAVSVVSVGSVTPSKEKTRFSAIGPSYDGRIKPEVMAQGAGVVVANASGTIRKIDGTSFSCPIIAGLIACLWQAFPSKTNTEIRQMVLESADRYATPDNDYGYGIPNFASSLGAESIQDTTVFVVYPNPAESIVSFSFFKEGSTATVSIYSVLGQKLIEAQISKQNPIISLQSLNSGLYFYTFDAADLHKRGKIIKQ